MIYKLKVHFNFKHFCSFNIHKVITITKFKDISDIQTATLELILVFFVLTE